MSMHMMSPALNDIGRAKRKPSAKLKKAKQAHEQWLRERGLHVEQLATKPKHKNVLPVYQVDKAELSNSIPAGGSVRGMMANIHREPKHVQAQIRAKQGSVTQLYNKGGYGVVVPSDGRVLGSQSRRG